MRQLIILFLLVIVFTACNNELVNDQTVEQKVEIFKAPLQLLNVPSQIYEINTNKDTVITGLKGTKITLTRGCFDTNSEQIRIELKEYYNFPSMIMGGLCTKSNDKILETDGMIYINATTPQGDSVALKKDKQISLGMPSSNIGMRLFYGVNGQGVDWVEAKDEMFIDINEGEDSIVYALLDVMLENNIFEITQLGWINADKFIDCENKTDLFVSLPENQEGAVYSLAFYNYNSILPGVPNDKGQLVFKGVPANEQVTLMGIGSKDDALYYSSLNLSTDTKNAKLPALKEISKDELQVELENNFGNDLAQRPQPRF